MMEPLNSDPKLAFLKVADKIRSHGISTQQLSSLKSIQTLLRFHRRSSSSLSASWTSSSRIQLIAAAFICLAAVLITALIRWELYTSHGFAIAWLTWKNLDVHNEQCTIDMPSVVQDIFRPPVKCSMCEAVFQVDRVSNITSEEFRESYAYTGRPVVVEDAARNWTALHTFSFDFFKALYGDESPALENFRFACQFFPYQTEFHSLREVFNMTDERSKLADGSKPWYIGWSNCDSSVTNILRQYYDRPYFLPTDAESSRTDWIFMGSPGYGAHMHIDHVGNPSWQAQISGQKTWILLPPPECAHVCQKLEVTVHPGEMIVLDTNAWYHQTLTVGDNLSITIGSEYD